MHQGLTTAWHLLAQCQQAGGRRLAKVQVAIGVVFDNEGVVTQRQFQNLAAALQAQQSPAGIPKGRDQVNKLGLMLCDQGLQAVGLHAVGVDGGADQLGPIQTKALDRGQESRAFDNHFVTGADQGFAQQVQRLLAARGDDQILRLKRMNALALHEGRQFLTKWVKTLRGTVLQGCTRLFAQGLLTGFTNALDIKQGAVGEAACKADDAGLAQELEQLPDGRRLDVLQAVGELNKTGRGGVG